MNTLRRCPLQHWTSGPTNTPVFVGRNGKYLNTKEGKEGSRAALRLVALKGRSFRPSLSSLSQSRKLDMYYKHLDTWRISATRNHNLPGVSQVLILVEDTVVVFPLFAFPPRRLPTSHFVNVNRYLIMNFLTYNYYYSTL